jgi:hypothetical protein
MGAGEAPLPLLDPFVSAKVALKAAGSTGATAISMHPLDYEIAGKMPTCSNEPLVSGELAATDAPAESILGVSVYRSTGIPRSKVIVAQANELLVVRRSDVETAVDENYAFSTPGVGCRTIARLALILVSPPRSPLSPSRRSDRARGLHHPHLEQAARAAGRALREARRPGSRRP